MNTKQLVNEEVVADAYEQWKQHPVTKLMFANLQKHRLRFAELIARQATDVNVTAEQIRWNACCLRTTSAIIDNISSYELFSKYLKEQ